MVAHLIRFRNEALSRWRMPILLGGILAVVVSWVFAMASLLDTAALRAAIFGLSFSVLILGLVLTEMRSAHRWRDSKLAEIFIQLGDASYSIYLVHFVPLFLMSILCKKLGLTGRFGAELVTAVCCLTIIAVGWGAYRIMEHPMLQFCRRMLFSRAGNVRLVNPQ